MAVSIAENLLRTVEAKRKTANTASENSGNVLRLDDVTIKVLPIPIYQLDYLCQSIRHQVLFDLLIDGKSSEYHTTTMPLSILHTYRALIYVLCVFEAVEQ